MTKQWSIDDARRVMREGGRKVNAGGQKVFLDRTTAGVMIRVFDKLTPAQQEQAQARPLTKFVAWVWKQAKAA